MASNDFGGQGFLRYRFFTSASSGYLCNTSVLSMRKMKFRDILKATNHSFSVQNTTFNFYRGHGN